MTINSGRLLATCRIETACPPLLVKTTVAAELEVFTVTGPKLSEAGLTPTPAWIGVDKNTELTKNNPRDRHTSRVLCMRGNPSCSIQVREQNGAEGISFANRDSYFQREDTTGGKVRFGTGVLWFSDWHALLLKGCDIVKLHFDVLLERRSVATLFFLYATCVCRYPVSQQRFSQANEIRQRSICGRAGRNRIASAKRTLHL